MQHINVYEVMKADKLILSCVAFQNIQRELIAQYTYNGKRKNALKALETLARANSKLAQPAEQLSASESMIWYDYSDVHILCWAEDFLSTF